MWGVDLSCRKTSIGGFQSVVVDVDRSVTSLTSLTREMMMAVSVGVVMVLCLIEQNLTVVFRSVEACVQYRYVEGVD
jgi:hypothetical protein